MKIGDKEYTTEELIVSTINTIISDLEQIRDNREEFLGELDDNGPKVLLDVFMSLLLSLESLREE